MEIFLLINPDTALIQKPQNLYLEELQLENSHLIGGHIDICLWPTKEGEKPDPRAHYRILKGSLSSPNDMQNYFAN